MERWKSAHPLKVNRTYEFSIWASFLLLISDSKVSRKRGNHHPVRQAGVVTHRMSYLTVTVLSNKVTWNRIVLSFEDSLRKPLGRRPRQAGIRACPPSPASTSPISFLLCGTYYTSNRAAHSPNSKLLFPPALSGHLIHFRPRLEIVKHETARILHSLTNKGSS